MEWLKELLKNAGVEESKIDSIVGDFNKEAPKHLVPKDKYNELAKTKEKLEGDLSERDGQLESLSKAAGATEELKKEIQRLQDENAEAKKNYEAELKTTKLTSAIKAAIGGKVHDEELVASLIDSEKLIVDGDKVTGLDEQLKALQETKSFLFKQEDGGGSTFTFRGTPPADGSPGGESSKVSIGKQLAAQNKQADKSLQEAQANYFK